MNIRVFVLCSIWALGVAPAAAQTWYAPKCCPRLDCRPVQADEVRFIDGGYQIPSLGITVGSDDRRVMASKDARYHICTKSLATPDLDITAWYLKVDRRVLKCLYVPVVS